MSIFRKINNYINNSEINSIFTRSDIEKLFNYNESKIYKVMIYINHYINADLIIKKEYYHMETYSHKIAYHIIDKIPYHSILTISELKKLKNKSYKKAYIRNNKIKLIKNKYI